LIEDGIRVNTVAPALIETDDMVRELEAKLGGIPIVFLL
jgi:NAD(P)-dependent dehydrogenase (short-subunit alcohol dehydrogenase family)